MEVPSGGAEWRTVVVAMDGSDSAKYALHCEYHISKDEIHISTLSLCMVENKTFVYFKLPSIIHCCFLQ